MNPSIRPGRAGRLRAFRWIALSLFLGAAFTHSQEGLSMRVLKLHVTSGAGDPVGLGIGARPPDFTLPDLYTGELVSLSDYRGRKAVFYMWASW